MRDVGGQKEWSGRIERVGPGATLGIPLYFVSFFHVSSSHPDFIFFKFFSGCFVCIPITFSHIYIHINARTAIYIFYIYNRDWISMPHWYHKMPSDQKSFIKVDKNRKTCCNGGPYTYIYFAKLIVLLLDHLVNGHTAISDGTYLFRVGRYC